MNESECGGLWFDLTLRTYGQTEYRDSMSDRLEDDGSWKDPTGRSV